MLSIRVINSKRDLREFIRLPAGIYPKDSPWVRPLDQALADYLRIDHNPFFQDGVARAFLVERDGRFVGRILAHVWSRHQKLHAERTGYFGFLECAHDPAAARLLLDSAADFARDQGCDWLRGPFNMTAAQEMGIMTAGFDHAPAVDMVFTAPWYPQLLADAGFSSCLSMRTWRNPDIGEIDADNLITPRHRELQLRWKMSVRTLRRGHRSTDLELVREVVNSGFLGNWSFVPITREEWKLQVGPVVPLLDPELVLLAEVRGIVVGVTLCVPDFNELLRSMQGKLLHPAALRLLHRRPTDGALVILFAVRKQFQGLGVNRLLNAELVRRLKRRGYRSLAITWVADTNAASLAQARALGMQPLHDVAMYERRIP